MKWEPGQGDVMGRRVLITGCSTGIGRATAVEMAERGYEVIATARRPEMLTGLDALALPLDVDDNDSVDAAVEAAGEIDVLVNNAGWGVGGPVEKVPLDVVRGMLETNVLGVMRLVQAVAPVMRRRGSGAIVNVSSVAGRVSTPNNGTYAASKHALEAISEALYYELGHFGIRVSIVEPGTIDTSWHEKEPWFGVDEPPYDELFRQAGREVITDEVPGPEVVAARIIEAIETDEPRLRWPAGDGAELVLAARAKSDDARWERLVRETMGLTW